MTSFIINAHEGRSIHSSWRQDNTCAFCKIIRGELSAFKLYEDDKVIAILGEPILVMSFVTTQSHFDVVQISCLFGMDTHLSFQKHTLQGSLSCHLNLPQP